MKTAMQEVLDMINNRTANSLKTKFTKDEKNFWIEKQKQEIIHFAVWFNNNDNAYKSYDEIVSQYYNSTFGDNPEAGI